MAPELEALVAWFGGVEVVWVGREVGVFGAGAVKRNRSGFAVEPLQARQVRIVFPVMPRKADCKEEQGEVPPLQVALVRWA